MPGHRARHLPSSPPASVASIVPCLLPCLLAALLARPAPAQAGEWKLLGPPGGLVTTVEVHPGDPSRAWAGTGEAGLYRSDDGGRTWIDLPAAPIPGRDVTLVEPEIHRLVVRALAVDPFDPDTVWMAWGGVPSLAVFRSRDAGVTWDTLDLPTEDPLAPKEVGSLALTREMTPTVFAGSNQGVFRSRDRGATWELASPSESAPGGEGAVPASVDALALDPRDPERLWALDFDNLWRSDDQGDTWTRLEVRFPSPGVLGFRPRIRAVAGPGGGISLWALAEGEALIRSRDGGLTWEARSPDPERFDLNLLDGVDLEVFPERGPLGGPRIWLAGFSDGRSRVFFSPNGGATWKDRTFDLPDDVRDLGMASADGAVLAGSRDELLRRPAGGESWEPTLQNLSSRPTFSLAVNPREPAILLAVAHQELGDVVFRTTDGGENWEELAVPGQLVVFHPGVRSVEDSGEPRAWLLGGFPSLRKGTAAERRALRRCLAVEINPC